MVISGQAVVADAIFVPREMVISMYTITPGYFKKVGKTDAGEFFFAGGGADGGQVVPHTIADPAQGLIVRAKDGALCVVTVFNFLPCDRPQAAVTFPSAEGFERRTRTVPGDASQQALIYNGRDGNRIRLLYRAVSTPLAPAVSNQVEYDVSASPVIEYRGARIEVLEATTRSIRYRLLQQFRPPS